MDIGDMLFVRVVTKLSQWLAYFSAALILAMSLWITYDVLARHLFQGAAAWAFDLSEYTLIWVTFLAAPWMLLREGHVRVELLVDSINPRAQKALGVAVSLVGILVCAILAWRSGIAAVDYYQNDIMMPRIWRIPKLWPYMAIPVGSSLLVAAFIVRLMVYIKIADPEAELHRRNDGVGDGH